MRGGPRTAAIAWAAAIATGLTGLAGLLLPAAASANVWSGSLTSPRFGEVRPTPGEELKEVAIKYDDTAGTLEATLTLGGAPTAEDSAEFFLTMGHSWGECGEIGMAVAVSEGKVSEGLWRIIHSGPESPHATVTMSGATITLKAQDPSLENFRLACGYAQSAVPIKAEESEFEKLQRAGGDYYFDEFEAAEVLKETVTTPPPVETTTPPPPPPPPTGIGTGVPTGTTGPTGPAGPQKPAGAGHKAKKKKAKAKRRAHRKRKGHGKRKAKGKGKARKARSHGHARGGHR